MADYVTINASKVLNRVNQANMDLSVFVEGIGEKRKFGRLLIQCDAKPEPDMIVTGRTARAMAMMLNCAVEDLR